MNTKHELNIIFPQKIILQKIIIFALVIFSLFYFTILINLIQLINLLQEKQHRCP